ncbi:hypothetical protein [Bacillus marinisedimentorum]|uniref:hypothetical protein n=1 Tax=Bacillus marinisedimentorum TaxID=1821260 RepID=UPI001470C5CF|nr:hypothetical protein [Bacillus marinisedimentorum]
MSIGLLFLFILRKQIFNKKLIYVVVTLSVIFGGYQHTTIPFVSQEEAIAEAKKTVAPYTKNHLYQDQIKVELVNPKNMFDQQYAVIIDITSNSYAEVYVDIRNGEILKARIHNLSNEDIVIK